MTGYHRIDQDNVSLVPVSALRSGHVLSSGIVLAVARCAPEHGGGVLAMMALGDMPLAPDDMVLVYGIVDDTILAALRGEWGVYRGIHFSQAAIR